MIVPSTIILDEEAGEFKVVSNNGDYVILDSLMILQLKILIEENVIKHGDKIIIK